MSDKPVFDDIFESIIRFREGLEDLIISVLEEFARLAMYRIMVSTEELKWLLYLNHLENEAIIGCYLAIDREYQRAVDDMHRFISDRQLRRDARRIAEMFA